jgi:hypothetical protein
MDVGALAQYGVAITTSSQRKKNKKPARLFRVFLLILRRNINMM